MDHNARRNTLTPQQRSLYGAMGAAVARARHKPADLTAEARRTFLSRFDTQARELHPDADDAELARVAGELKRAHFLKLAAASSRARGKRKAATAINGDGPEVDRDSDRTPTAAA